MRKLWRREQIRNKWWSRYSQGEFLTGNAGNAQDVCRGDTEAVEDVTRAVGINDVDPTGVVLAGADPGQWWQALGFCLCHILLMILCPHAPHTQKHQVTICHILFMIMCPHAPKKHAKSQSATFFSWSCVHMHPKNTPSHNLPHSFHDHVSTCTQKTRQVTICHILFMIMCPHAPKKHAKSQSATFFSWSCVHMHPKNTPSHNLPHSFHDHVSTCTQKTRQVTICHILFMIMCPHAPKKHAKSQSATFFSWSCVHMHPKNTPSHNLPYSSHDPESTGTKTQQHKVVTGNRYMHNSYAGVPWISF